MRTKLVRIGNSRGVRIPAPLLRECGLLDEVELEVGKNELVIRAPGHSRAGWDEAFERMAERGDDAFLDADAHVESAWDREEWQWP